MTWLIWRQYRLQAAITAAIFAVFAVIIIITGLKLASQWHSLLLACGNSQNCLQQHGQLSNQVGHDAVILTNMVPALIGVFLGAPLVAHEIETGTVGFAWTQSITRKRWLYTKIGWTLLAAAVWGGVVAALVTWWSGPRNALMQNAFQPNTFDLQYIVPIGYAVFATALGICAGTLLRRTLPAIAIVLGGFIGMRLWVSQDLRQHFMTPVTTYFNLLHPFSPPAGSLQLSSGTVNAAGQALVSNSPLTYMYNGIPVNVLPDACQKLINQKPGSATQMHAVASCINNAGIRGVVTYQPADRFWAFQGIETGIYLLVAAVLVFVAARVLLRRGDA